MGKTRNLMTKLLAVAVLAGLGMVHAAKADSYMETSTFYYAGPETGTTDNPFSIVNVGGNAASTLNLTNAGSTGTLSINTVTNPAISLTGSQFTVTLYGVPNTLLSGGNLVTGTYNFNSSFDYFGIETAGNGATTGFGCNAGQTCNVGANPVDQVTLNVAANGVVTLQSSSLELVTKVSSVTTGVPEIDPSSALSPLALLGGVMMIFRGRRRLA
jgi:hypothetical protein